MDEVDFTILAAKSVFSDLMDKCPPAETCRDAFDRTAKATIKMANSTGGFGSVPNRKSKENRIDWASQSGDGSSTASLSRRRQAPPQQAPFQFDMSLSDNLSSPSLSASGELPPGPSPSIARSKTFESDPFSAMGARGQPSPVGTASLDPSMIHSPTLVRQGTAPQLSTSSNTPYLSQPQPPYRGTSNSGAGNTKLEYGDPHMADFFQSLQQMGQDGGAGSTGDMPSFPGTGPGGDMAQQQLDLGFGINWDNLHHDFSDGGQQMNIFDGFFFGGQQQQNGGGSGGNEGGL